MSTVKSFLFVLSVLVLLFNLTSCSLLPSQKVEADDVGRCSQTSEWRTIYVEGHFGESRGMNGGYENRHPSGVFIFSNQPGAKTGFEVYVPVVIYNTDGATEKANKFEYKEDDKNIKQIIYDNNEQVINPNDRVRITGYKLTDDGCTIKVQKIEKL